MCSRSSSIHCEKSPSASFFPSALNSAGNPWAPPSNSVASTPSADRQQRTVAAKGTIFLVAFMSAILPFQTQARGKDVSIKERSTIDSPENLLLLRETL